MKSGKGSAETRTRSFQCPRRSKAIRSRAFQRKYLRQPARLNAETAGPIIRCGRGHKMRDAPLAIAYRAGSRGRLEQDRLLQTE
jgi:hypothetical protein